MAIDEERPRRGRLSRLRVRTRGEPRGRADPGSSRSREPRRALSGVSARYPDLADERPIDLLERNRAAEVLILVDELALSAPTTTERGSTT